MPLRTKIAVVKLLKWAGYDKDKRRIVFKQVIAQEE